MNPKHFRPIAAATLTAALLLTGCSNNPAAYKSKGDTYFDAGQNQIAIENYEEYLNQRAGDEAARYNLSQAYMRINQPAKAADNLRILHTQSPRNGDYTEALAEALLAADRRDELYRLLKSEAVEQQTMEDWLRLGRFALKLGDKDTALVAFLAAAKVDGGKSWQPQIALYDYYRSMGQRPEAVRRLRMAAWVAPMNAEVTKRIAESGEVTGPTFPLRPTEWDARAHEDPIAPFNPFEQRPGNTTGTVEAPSTGVGASDGTGTSGKP